MVRVFNINKAVGRASSGVEYAQRYRRGLLAGIDGVEDFYLFTDYLSTNVAAFTDPLGFERSQVLWIYDLLSGRPTQPCTVTVDDLVATIQQPHGDPRPVPDYVEVDLTDTAVRHRIKTAAGPGGEALVDHVDTLHGGRLVCAEHYDTSLNNVEHFCDDRLVRRTFYTPEGRVAAEQTYRDREILRTLVKPASPLYDDIPRKGRPRPAAFAGDVMLEGRAQFFRYVIERLLSEPDDVVVLDRALEVIDGIYPVIGEHRLYSVVHAEHYDLKQAEDGVLLWNNHYEYVFTRPDLVDAYLVSTKRQQEVLEAQLAAQHPGAATSVVTIPVGVIETPVVQPHYERFALVTASRLADEKHIDWLIRAVAAARDTLPELRLDIFGEGDRDPLLAVIEETGAHDFVRLMGHHRLDRVLGPYGLYVTASTSEGFGLSLLEAIAEGLPIVGFDVDYGNREMVDRGLNGALVPFTSTAADIDALAEAIVETLSSPAFDQMRRHSAKKAEAYTASHVRDLWAHLLLPEEP